MADSYAACVNGNEIAEMLEEAADIKNEMIQTGTRLNAGPRWWAERAARWSVKDRLAAKRVRQLVAEIERLRQFERVD